MSSHQIECPRQQKLVVVTSGNISMLALFSYDYLLSFSREVEFMWNGPFHFTTVLYFIARYLPFSGIVFFLTAESATISKQAFCPPLLRFIDSLSILARTAITVVLIFQTYAMYNKSRIILVILGALALAIVAIDGFEVAADKCDSHLPTNLVWRQRLALIILTVFSTITMALILCKSFGLLRQKHSLLHSVRSASLPRLMLFEGLSLSAVCLLRLLDVLLLFGLPRGKPPTLLQTAQTPAKDCASKPVILPIAAIFISHFLINIRDMQACLHAESQTTTKSLEFTTIPLDRTQPGPESAMPEPSCDPTSHQGDSVPFSISTSRFSISTSRLDFRVHESWMNPLDAA